MSFKPNSDFQVLRRLLLTSTALFAALTVVAIPALAQTWDGDTGTSWGTPTNWNPDGLPAAGATVTISNGALTNQPTVDANRTVAQTNISAGTLTVAATLTSPVAVSGTGSLAISSTGGVVGAVSQSGSAASSSSDGTITGTLSVAGGSFVNRGVVTGATSVTGGTLTLAAGSNLANGAALTVQTSGTLDLGGLSETVGSVAGTGTIRTGGAGGALIAGGDNTSTTFSGTLSGAVRSLADDGNWTTNTIYLQKTGTGTLTLSGQDQTTGGGTMQVTAGTLALTGGSAVANDSYVYTLASGILAVNQSETVGFAGGAGTVAIADGQTLTLAGLPGAHAFGDQINSTGNGNLVIGLGDDGVGLSGALNHNGSTTISSGTVNLWTSLNNSTDLVVSGGTLNVTSNGALTGDLNDDVELTLSSGTLAFGHGDLIATAEVTGGTLGLVSGTPSATLALSGDYAQSGGTLASGLTVVAAGTGTLTGGTIAGTLVTGSTTVGAGGTVTLTGTIDSGVTVADGTLRLGSTGVVNGTITTTGSVISYANGQNNAAQILVASNSTQLSVDDGDTATQSGTINEDTAGRPLEKIGDGKLILTAGNTYSGVTTVSEGVLNIRNVNALGSTAGGTVVASGATLEVEGDMWLYEGLTLNGSGDAGIGALNLVSGHIDLSGSITLASDATITTQSSVIGDVFSGITGTGADLTLDGSGTFSMFSSISTGSGGLIKNGTGTVYLYAPNAFTGATTVNGGSLVVQGWTTLSDTSTTTVNSGATLRVEVGENVGSLAGSGNVVLNYTLGTGGDNTSTTFSGVISGSDGLTKTGSGTMTLSGSNSYSGTTLIEAGMVTAANSSALGSGAAGTTVSSGAALGVQGNITLAENITLNGTGVTNGGALRNISGNNTLTGAITLGSNARINSDAGTLAIQGGLSGTNTNLTLGGAGATTISGAIATGTGSLTKDGTGTATLSGASSFSGATNVNAGTLVASGTYASTTLNVSGGTLTTRNGALNAAATAYVSSGSLDIDDADTIAALVQTGGTVAGDAQLTTNSYSQAGGATDGTVTVATVTFNQSAGGTIAEGTTVSHSGAANLGGGAINGTLAAGATPAATVTATGGTTLIGATGSVTSTDISLSGGNIDILSGGTLGGTNAAIAVNNGTLTTRGGIADSATVGVGAATGTLSVAANETIAALQQTDGTIMGTSDAILTVTGATGFVQSGGTTSGDLVIATTLFDQSGGTIGSGTEVRNSGAATLNSATLNGAINGTGSVTAASGTTEIGTTGSISRELVVAAGAGVNNSGNLADVANGGTFDNDGGTGTVRNSGSANNTGTMGALQNSAGTTTNTGVISGTVQVTGGLFDQNLGGSVLGTTTIGGLGTATNTGSVAAVINGGSFTNEDRGTAGTVDNSGSFVNQTGASAGVVTNSGSGSNAGTIAALVNSGGFDNTGGISGSLSNAAGTTNTSGTVGGAVSVTGGTVRNSGTVAGAANVGTAGLLENSGTLAGVDTAGQFTNEAGGTAAAVTNSGSASNAGTVTGAVVNAAGTMTNTGRVQGTVTVNGGLFDQNTGGVVDGTTAIATAGTVTNAGSLAATSNSGNFTNEATGTAGAVTNTASGIGENAGTIATLANSGTFTNSGSVSGNASTGGGTTTNSGTIAGTLAIAAGNVANSGTVTGATTILQGATVTNSGSLSVATGIVNDGTLTNQAGGIAGDVVNTGWTSFHNEAGATAGDIDNSGYGTNAGTIASLTNSGAFVNGGTVTGDATNTEGTLDNSGAIGGKLAISGGSVTHRGSAGSLEQTGGTLAINGGAVSGTAVKSAGTLAIDGATLDGGLTVSGGTTTLQGAIDGSITTSTDVALSANATGTARSIFTLTTGTLDLDGFAYTGLGEVRNTGGTLLVADGTLGAATVTNAATLQLALGRIEGALVNTSGGTINVVGAGNSDGTGGSTITGALTNAGTVTMANGVTGDLLNVGGLSGSGTYAMDLNLTDGTSDKIVGTGAASTANLNFNFSLLGNGGYIGDPIVVYSGPAVASATTDTLPIGGVITYQLDSNSSGVQVVSSVNNAVAGIASGAAATQSLIAAVVNRPTSPFVSGLAAEESCSSGGYVRGTIGRGDVTGRSNSNGVSRSNTVGTNFSGVQAGYDWGCFDGRFFDGWDGAAGFMVGYNTGSTRQDVFAYGDSQPATGSSGSDFDQKYIGLYLAGSKDRISGDLQLRVDRTEFELSETVYDSTPIYSEDGEKPFVGLDGLKYDVSSTTLGARLNYRFDIDEKAGIAFVPTVGLNYSRSGGDTLTFRRASDGNITSTLKLNDYHSVIGFLGGTVTRTKIADSGTSATTLFASGNYYHDFAGDRTADFTSFDPDTGIEQSSSVVNVDGIGGFAEASIGVNYVKVLDNGPGGAKQLNANLRADARFGQNVKDSYSLTAQVRLSF